MTKEQKLELYNQAKEAYYNGAPIMTDFEFDELEKELGLENKGYVGTKHSPNYTIKHPVIMGSLSKVQIKEDSNGEVDWSSFLEKVMKFISIPQEVIVTPKYDGCSFEAIIYKGEIKSISSRGDGTYGKDLKKHLINHVKPNVTLPFEHYVLRGEVLVKKDIFEKKYSKDFVNTRSFVAGVLGADYSSELQEKINDLSIVIYDIKEIYNGEYIFEHDWFKFEYDLKDAPKFYNLINWNNTPDQLEYIYNTFNEYRKNCPFSLDGIVIKPDANHRLNDYTESRPKDCVALKFIPMLQETTVVDIKWNIGKTGELIPIIIVEPLEMDGKIVTRCSGHNYGYLIEKEVSVGTKVILSLAGDIIPFLYKVTDTKNYSEDKLCIPENYLTKIDGCHLMAILSEEEITKQKFLNSVTALNIPSIGPAGAEKIFDYLTNSNLSDETADFFGIENEKKELPNNILLVAPEDIWMGLGCGKTGENGKKAFSKIIKNITLVDIIKSCNFRLCGGKAAIQIEKYFTGQEYDFTHLPEVAINWAMDKNSDNYKQIEKIVNYLGRTFEDFKKIAVETASKDNDKIPVILTGEPTQYGTKANFLKAHPEYRMTGSWKEVKIVFTNSLESNTGKMKKAREKGIEIRLY